MNNLAETYRALRIMAEVATLEEEPLENASKLTKASLKGHKDVTELLMSRRADLVLTDKEGATALHSAINLPAKLCDFSLTYEQIGN